MTDLSEILEDVDPDEVPNMFRGRQGRFSHNLIKAFMEKGSYLTKVNHKKLGKTIANLSVGLSTHAKAHGLPIRVFQRDGTLYMVRLDILRDGSPDPDYVPPTPTRAESPKDLADVLDDDD